MKRFPNWFVTTRSVQLDIQVGTTLLTGHGANATVGEYVVTSIEHVDDDTAQITVKRVKR